MTWHILDVGSIWMKEFASALGRFTPALGWSPVLSWTGFAEAEEREEWIADPPQRIRYFPLQRGYHRFPLSAIAGLRRRQVKRMALQSSDPSRSPLICTTPYYAPVAESWPGPVIYYQTDLTVAYAGLNPRQVRALDRRLCRVAALVCPNSQRIGQYMAGEAGCDPAKIVIVPNATRAENILPVLPGGPAALPGDLADLPRPVAGVLGNLAANLDWLLLEGAVRQTPDYSWAFVGPTGMDVPEPAQRSARERLMAAGGRVRFVGAKSYGALQQYARALDVAVLPYRRKEPTYSGSSTRFYEHLAACRPMLSTRGFEELLHKEPLLRLVDTPEELAAGLAELRACGFEDGVAQQRWQASRSGTWSLRAATVIEAAHKRCGSRFDTPELPPQIQDRIDLASFDQVPGAPFRLISPDS